MPRPNSPKRSIRVPDPLWGRVKDRAAERGETASEAVRRLLESYVKDPR